MAYVSAILAAIIGVAMISTLVSPNHDTSSVIAALFAAFSSSLRAALGNPTPTKKAATK